MFCSQSLTSKILLVVLTICSYCTLCAASIEFTSVPSNVEDGTSVNIDWTTDDSSTPISIILKKGSSADLETVTTITSSATGDSYTWSVPTSLEASDEYVLEIVQGSDINYSQQFAITGGSTAQQSSSAALASSTPEPSSTPAPSTTPEPSSTPAPSSTPGPSSIQESTLLSTTPSSSSSAANSASSSSSAIPASTSIESSASSTASSSSIPASSSSSQLPTSSASQTPTSSKSASSGLTTGAKAGIGVGVPLGVLAIALGAFFLGRRKKTEKPTPGGEEGYVGRHELDGKDVSTNAPMRGAAVTELPVGEWDEHAGHWRTQPRTETTELPTRDNKHELAAKEG